MSRRTRTGALLCLLGSLVPAAWSAEPAGGMYQVYKSDTSTLNDGSFDTGPEPDMTVLVRRLSKAIDRLARYHVRKEPPPVYKVPRHEMEEYVCTLQCDVKAWYLSGQGIFLDESLKPETNLFDRSILLHELVHYYQDRSGEYGNMDPCNRWFHRELDAYTVQNRYLSAVGSLSHVGYTGTTCTEEAAQRKDTPQVYGGGKAEPAAPADGLRPAGKLE